MAWWNGQMAKDDYTLQFGTESKEEYQYIEKCCQKVMDNAYGWISVKDRLPGVCKDVLLYDKYNGIIVGFIHKDEFQTDFIELYDVTHWQPLPEPPESEV